MIFLINLKSIWIKCLDCKKCGVCRSMDYYLNEYSLRGQFKDTDEFMETLRTSTLPVLDRIKAENESILWKKDTFWNLEICNGIIISKIEKKKNERSPELIVLKNKLIQLCTEKPFWESEQESQTDVIKYDFDNAYCELFENPNCFLKAIENEGKIVSFIHEEYRRPQLPIVIRKEVFTYFNMRTIIAVKRRIDTCTFRFSQKFFYYCGNFIKIRSVCEVKLLQDLSAL